LIVSGLLDQNGQVIQSIDINYDSAHLFNQPWFQHGDRRKLLEVRQASKHLACGSTHWEGGSEGITDTPNTQQYHL